MIATLCQAPFCRGLLQSRCKLALACIVCRSAASNVMKTLVSWAPAPNLTVTAVESGEPDWLVSVNGRDAEQDRDRACCPVCGIQSSSRHSSYIRTLRDLSAQGRPVKIQARLTRWRRKLARRPISEFSWHAVGPRVRPKSGICSLISVIEATPARLATWRASSLRGAAAARPQEKRVSGLRRTRKPQHRRACEP